MRERTQELISANEQLRTEITERTRCNRRYASRRSGSRRLFRRTPMPMAILSRSESRFLDANASFFGTRRLPRRRITHAHRSGTSTLDGLYRAQKSRRWKTASISTTTPVPGAQRHAPTRWSSGPNRSPRLWRVCVADRRGRDGPPRLKVAPGAENGSSGPACRRSRPRVQQHSHRHQGHAELLRQEKIAPRQVTDSGGRISQASQRAAALTRQLLTFSRQQPVQLKPLSVSGVVRSRKNAPPASRRALRTAIPVRGKFAARPRRRGQHGANPHQSQH